ncbi:hypothetical protein BC937DRAFT_90800 [Endogone sp. FLAS-F59071]|nr:hypothetical protein BC937DRAFT_90800 [Endogone sp. FLAS-F59071]|eukprot:RUS16797.1 hypothetical protein BC937DRAFT_90800 [Endogone sp. FLAS-F59071]
MITYSIRVADDVRSRGAADILNKRPHLISTQSAVQTNSHRLAVTHGNDKGLPSLTRERTSGLIDNGAGNEECHNVENRCANE